MTREVFQGRNGRWYWHIRDESGAIVAIGGQGFPTEKAAAADAELAYGSTHRHRRHQPPPPRPNQPPVVSLGADVLSGVAPLHVHFSGTASDPDGAIAASSLDFGDLSVPLEGVYEADHVYQAGGAYSAVLKATDDKGEVGQAVVGISVTEPPLKPGLGISPDRGDAMKHDYISVVFKTSDGKPVPRPLAPVVNVKGYLPGSNVKADKAIWPAIAAGEYDAQLEELGAAALEDGVQVLVPHHEPMAEQGTPADFVAMYRRFVGVVRGVTGESVLFGPCYLGEWADPNHKINDGSFPADWYPGDDVVDVLCFDKYPRNSGADYATLVAPLVAAAEAHGKRLIHLETAAITGPALAYYRSILEQAPREPWLAAVYLWLADGTFGNYRIETLTPEEVEAVDDLIASPSFGRAIL